MREEAHSCPRNGRRPLNDARGIFCCFVCDWCEREKRARFRTEVFNDAAYPADEPIEEE